MAVITFMAMKHCDGHIIYLMDDPYIHMTIAKNLVEHGVWGVTAGQFASSSSSLLWTGLLAGIYYIFGSNDITPFVLNIIISSLLLLLLYRFASKYIRSNILKFLILLMIIWAGPLPTLIFLGLEHILHILIALAFLYISAKYLASTSQQSANNSYSNRQQWWVLILGIILSTARYEGLFMVFVVWIYLVIRKQFKFAFAFGIAVLLIPGLFGLYSLSRGWYILPNSVLLKFDTLDYSSLRGIANYIFRDIIKFYWVKPMVVLVIVGLSLYIINGLKKGKLSNILNISLVIFLFTAWLHFRLADIGWYYRYEAYLVIIGIYIVSVALVDMLNGITWNSIITKPKSVLLAISVMAVIMLFPLFWRGSVSSAILAATSGNIYEQQYQMGHFLREYYQNQPVAVNDIGATSYYGEIQTIDVWGLADMDITRAIRGGYYTPEFIDVTAKAKGAKIAIIYDNIKDMYLAGGVPENWIKIGCWGIANNNVCYSDSVYFYAIDRQETDSLRSHFIEYSKKLPDRITWILEPLPPTKY